MPTNWSFLFGALCTSVPMHIFSLVLMIFAWEIGHHYFNFTPENEAGFRPVAVIASLFLVQDWFYIASPNPVAWSISIEFASYLLFLLVAVVTGKLPKWWPFVGLLLSFALALTEWSRVLRGIGEFYFGFSAFALVDAYPIPSFPRWVTLAALFTPFLLSFYVGHEILALLIPCFALVVVGTTRGNDWLTQVLRSKPVWYFGEISYSVYMMQWVVWVFFTDALPRLAPQLSIYPYLLISSALLTIFGVSVVTFRFVEAPGRHYIIRLGGGARGASSPAGSSLARDAVAPEDA